MKIVVVTACLAGIAHSKIVAEALTKEGKKRGHEIFVEQQGGHKITKKVTEEEIDSADIVIVANAIAIKDKDRFENKKVYTVPIAKAIRDIKGTLDNAEKLVE